MKSKLLNIFLVLISLGLLIGIAIIYLNTDHTVEELQKPEKNKKETNETKIMEADNSFVDSKDPFVNKLVKLFFSEDKIVVSDSNTTYVPSENSESYMSNFIIHALGEYTLVKTVEGKYNTKCDSGLGICEVVNTKEINELGKKYFNIDNFNVSPSFIEGENTYWMMGGGTGATYKDFKTRVEINNKNNTLLYRVDYNFESIKGNGTTTFNFKKDNDHYYIESINFNEEIKEEM